MRQQIMRRVATAGLALAAAMHTAAADDRAWTLDSDGLGPFRIGMSFEQVQRVAGPRLQPTPPGLRASPGCDQLPLPGHTGVALMFIDGVLRRIDVVKPGIRTNAGVAVGDPAAQVARAYAGVVQEPNAYDERESYLTAGPEHGRAIRFETAKGRVGAMIGGDWAQVQYIEGCL